MNIYECSRCKGQMLKDESLSGLVKCGFNDSGELIINPSAVIVVQAYVCHECRHIELEYVNP